MKNLFLIFIILLGYSITPKAIANAFETNQFDIVINELLIKPSNNGNLPPFEYIELYNKSDKDIIISDWTITIGNRIYKLSDNIIYPKEYALIVKKEAEPYFNQTYNIITISSLSLNDKGQTIILKDKKNNPISYLSYSESWYDSDTKKTGGWSLEQIDYNNPCAGKENWRFCIDNLGGTPCKINSVFKNNPDIISPRLTRISYNNDYNITLHLSEPVINCEDLTDTRSYFISDMGNPDSAKIMTYDNSQIKITLPQQMISNKIYQITINETLICDCAGNRINKNKNLIFGKPELPDKEDIVFSEILFNPKIKKPQWIEIYNKSEKIIDLNDIAIQYSKDNDTNKIHTTFLNHFYIFSNEFIVITSEKKSLINSFNICNEDNILEVPNFPQLNITEGNIKLTSKGDSDNTIDKMYYEENMHFPLIIDKKGVSLEKISLDQPSELNQNWHSASKGSGFGTPTCKNSSSKSDSDSESNSDFNISPQIFSPDSDGYDDILFINYKTLKPGIIAEINIYNSDGKHIIKIASSLQLSTDGYLTWDGTDKYKNKVPSGIYILSIKTFDLEGNTFQKKFTAVVASKQY